MVRDLVTDGKIVSEVGNMVTIESNRPPGFVSDDVTIVWRRSECITNEQRKKIFAMINDIAQWGGYDLEDCLDAMKISYGKKISLSSCSKDDAREFIGFLVDFVVDNCVPTNIPMTNKCEDIGRYVYKSMMDKRCVVCGAKADLHHWDRVGMGRDRTDIVHVGMRAMPLCRYHHRICHVMSQEEFDNLYHVEPVIIDDDIADVYGLKKA